MLRATIYILKQYTKRMFENRLQSKLQCLKDIEKHKYRWNGSNRLHRLDNFKQLLCSSCKHYCSFDKL